MNLNWRLANFFCIGPNIVSLVLVIILSLSKWFTLDVIAIGDM